MRPSPILFSFLLLAGPALSQRLTVVLDAARGGTEYGARIDARTYEKQITLELAERLKTLLAARDFNVIMTRETDTLVTNEQRAAVANQNKSLACILLHATASGTGIHLWASSLRPQPPASTAVLWDEAQAPFLQRSQRLASEMSGAFSRSRIAVFQGHTWVRPLDNMQCPAVAVEIAPQDTSRLASDHGYQIRIAQTIADQLLVWRNHTDIVQSILNPPAPPKPDSVPSTGSAPESGKKPRDAAAPQGNNSTTPPTPAKPKPQPQAQEGNPQ